MQPDTAMPRPHARGSVYLVVLLVLVAIVAIGAICWASLPGAESNRVTRPELPAVTLNYFPRKYVDTSGYVTTNGYVVPWDTAATAVQIGEAFQNLGQRGLDRIDEDLADPMMPIDQQAAAYFTKASVANYAGNNALARESLLKSRTILEDNPAFAEEFLYSCIYFQGVTSLRQGENDNCIMCRGESSCILPISLAARHTNPEGSRAAIKHFTDYLSKFPSDLEVMWLLNLAHMTLGEYPDQVDPRYLVNIDPFLNSEFDIGKFRDIGEKVGVNNFNQAGGAIMDDFDNDGLLDLIVTSFDATAQMQFYRNNGQGKFENKTVDANLTGQLGGLNCVQTDYNNDGYLDIFIVRGAWLSLGMRPSLLRNNKDGTFTDVTDESGLMVPVNSIAASWADYDNDGWLDLFVCGEKQISSLYRNKRDGTFEDVTEAAGLLQEKIGGKGAAWLDYDNDGDADLFVNYLLYNDRAQLFRNNGNGTFRDVSLDLGIDGPDNGFSCWAWDYNNDGWLDIFATCYDRRLSEVVKGLQGKPHQMASNRLFRNQEGKGFQDVTSEAGLDMVFATMGSNFSDFDNDGYLDMYLGTGEPDIATLIPNRMFKNVDGNRFAEITTSSGTGHLQKGHGVACGDWDQDGDNDLFIEMGGAIPGDMYHNVLFDNPGNSNNWLTVKLVGKKSNRAAIGARIKIVTAGASPRTIHRHITTGSSFGANPLQQTIGLGQAEKIAELTIEWPTSKSVQTFRDVPTNQSIEITEFADSFQSKQRTPAVAVR